MAQPAEHISHSVGVNGGNRPLDVAWIQAYLNMAPPAQGGPAVKLKQDGLFGPKTQKAIEGFQKFHFGASDSRVDPGKRTEQQMIDLEESAATRPNLHIEDARRQAQIWMRAGVRQVTNHIAPDGTVMLRGAASQAFVDLFHLTFRLSLRGTGDKTQLERHLRFVRQKMERADLLLTQRIRVLKIRFMAFTDELRPPKLVNRAPLAVGGSIILADYKFTDFDAACGFGTGPMTRAAMLLQAAFIAADFFPLATVVADEAFIRSGLGPAELAIRESGNYSFFCQGMAAGGRMPEPFHHAPQAVKGWEDRPGLP